MTRICVADVESFYGKGYTLTSMTTEAYVRDKRFQLIGASFKWDDEDTFWLPRPEAEAYLRETDWSDTLIVAQNCVFDASILAWHYGVKPAGWLDTLGMSRALFPHEKTHSLKAQAERMGVGVKGTEVENAIGKRYEDFTPEELARYGEYCCNDVELTYELFHKYMRMGFPKQELKLIDMTIRMFTEPRLTLDREVLEQHLKGVKAYKLELLEEVRDQLLSEGNAEALQAVVSEGVDGIKKLLMSNDKFAAALRSVGVEPPVKVSPTTGKQAYAFAKTDEEFKALEEHEDLRVQALVAARLGNKTTLEETRTERFIDMSYRGAFPIPLRYYGAHSGRWSGQDSINLQNLPSRGKYAGKIKRAIRAPEGHVVIDCDSAQIEARVLAWLAGQEDLVQAFRDKQDVYKLMASKIYGVPPEEVNKTQRQVGKTTVLGCFGPDTPVLTSRGWVPIIHVQATDMVWDGVEWAPHAGVIPQGEKDVWTYQGISATSDHEILTERGWEVWREVIENHSLWQSAKLAVTLPSLIGYPTPRRVVGESGGTPYASARVGGLASWLERTFLKVGARAATHARKSRRIQSGIGRMRAYAQTKLSELGCLIASQLVYHDAITRTRPGMTTTAGVGFTSTLRGELTASRSLNTYSDSKGTTNRSWSWTGLMSIKDMSRAISGLLGVPPTWLIGERSGTCKSESRPLKQRMQTYDIAYAGSRNRYVVLTDDGPLIVHNCGYGVGHVKLQAFLKIQAGVEVTLDESKRIIDTYRYSADMIAALWKRSGDSLMALMNGHTMQVDIPGIIHAVPGKGLTLPNGLHIQYPNLRVIMNKEDKREIVYTSKGLPVRVYGGKVTENICQAVARQVVAEQMLRIQKRYPVVLTVHDAAAIVAPIDEAKEAQAFVEECMSWVPSWATGLPLACESGMGASYGDC